jgi:hypothetical protein
MPGNERCSTNGSFQLNSTSGGEELLENHADQAVVEYLRVQFFYSELADAD